MGLKLQAIKIILDNPNYNLLEALEQQKKQLLLEKERLEEVIQTVDKTLISMKGSYKMTSEEKFKGLKEERVRINEEKYGEEIRQKYGEEVVEASIKNS